MDVFAEARRLTTWHYQWLIVHEFLPQIVGQDAGRRRASPRPPLLQAGARRGVHPGRVPDRHLPDGAQHGAALVPRQPRRRRRPAVLRLRLRSRRRRARPTPTTCAAGAARRGGSSAGRPSSTSATARSSRTRRSTPRSRRRSSTCRSARSRATTRPRRCRSATCSGTSPGSFPRGRASRARWESRRSPPPTSQELAPLDVGFERSTPLWYYVAQGGRGRRGRASPRAGRRPDRRRGLHRPAADPTRPRTSPAQPRWQPTLPAKNGTFRMTDFLTFAGVDPHSRGQ